ncbi:restriction endonuclease [Haloarcula sp. NS06]|uniref:restriction endonuclease n=1 Tax=Haloarcula sp. NS06 TaxID=3409688 RepID=UPI003DA77DE9
MKPDEFREWSEEITDRQFEQVVGHIYDELGWDARVTQSKKDGGMDVKLYKNEKRQVVSVKQQVEDKSGIAPIHLREIVGVAVRVNATKAILVTNGQGSNRTQEEEKIYRNHSDMDVELVELMDLYEMVVQNNLFEVTEKYDTSLRDKVNSLLDDPS